jgi:NADPH-dependent 7-cyano-7-deazaguanine reductase QueF
MVTIVRGTLVHRCPFRDELDVGTVELTFDGPAVELHALGTLLASFAAQKITHEDLTELLATETGASVVTRWTTAGLGVEVRA